MPWKNIPCAMRDFILVEFDPHILNVCGSTTSTSTSTEVRMGEVGLSHACNVLDRRVGERMVY